MAGLVKPINVIPTKKSGTADWTSYWDALVARYGKNAASTVFAITWRERKGDAADVNTIRNYTKLPLDNESALDALKGAGSSVLGVFDGLGTAAKIGVYAVGGIAIILIGGIVVRIITASAKDIGTAGGYAAKAYTGKP